MKVNRTELLILVFFLILNLRLLTWYGGDNLLIRGDFRPPIDAGAVMQHSLNLWNQVDFGLPSVYVPRLLDPFISSTLLFESTGVSPQVAELVGAYLVYMVVSVLSYLYVKLVTGDKLAGLVGAVFFVSNVLLVIDMEQSAIGFIASAAMILPSLVAFLFGLKRKSVLWVGLSGFLFVLNYGSFPNYRNALLCLVSLAVTLSLVYYKDRSIPLKKYLASFALSVSAASVWIVSVVSTNYSYLFNAFSQVNNTNYGGVTYPLDVLRLITKWSFYDTYLGRSYTVYHDAYSSNLVLIALTLVPTILAFASPLLTRRRKLAVFFCVFAAAGLVLTSGVIPFGEVPFMLIFREPVNWAFLVILPFSVLIGLFASGLTKRVKKLPFKLLGVCLIFAVLFASAYPLFTGAVSDNWLTDGAKGSSYPSYMMDAQAYIDNRYWTLLLPYRSSYLVYNFTEGILVCANIYPTLTSYPYISGQGTEYIQTQKPQVLNDLYTLPLNDNATYEYFGELGIKYVLVETKVILGNNTNPPQLGLPIVHSWENAVLYENPCAQEKLYTSNNSSISWAENSPTKYRAEVNATEPFDLVFLENYEANWKVTVNGNSVPESSHMTYDGFANKWTIGETGNLEIEVFYAPQSLFVWTTLLSVTLIAVAFFVLWVLNTGKKPAEALRIFFDLVAKIAHKIAGKFRKN